MDHLGPLDIHITKDHTNISTKFFVSKDDALQLLEKNVGLLKDALNEQGYSFSSEFAEKKKTSISSTISLRPRHPSEISQDIILI